MRAPRRIVAATIVPFLLLGACTTDASHPGFTPSFREEACPEDLEPLLIPPHTCGFLTVLQDRSRPDGRTIDLFVVRVEPQAGRPTNRYPMYIAGTNLATSHQFFDLTQAAERLQRETIIMEPRGVGRSRPSLDCPEVDAISRGALEAGIADPSEHARFLDAVSACRARLTEAGIDVAAYDLPAMAADAEDLRRELGIDSWGLMTYGTASLVALEVLREEPSHVEQMIMDSPSFPQADPRTVAVVGTRLALDHVLEACRMDPRCAKAYPRLGGLLRRVTIDLDTHPVLQAGRASSGARVTVRLDTSTLLRVLRTLLVTRVDAPKAEEPATIEAASQRRLTSIVTGILTTESPFCIGYLPQCDGGHPVAEGTYLSVVCRDLAPWLETDTDDLERVDRSYLGAFVRDPWFAACPRWDVPPADPSVSRPVATDVSTLIVLGRYDPFAPASIVEQAASSFMHSWIVVDPVGGHNALGHSTCMIQMRNDWADDPSLPPDSSCITSMTPKVFDLKPS